jgi:glycosyltransferase involved in cell wall biosynthesis
MQVSIVIIHYQKPDFLASLLAYLTESIPTSIAERVEIIVVDNLSKDSEYVKTIAKQYLHHSTNEITTKFIFLDSNHGPSYARNRGADIAQGDYIQFLDEDDWFSPLKLSHQYNFAISNGYPSFVASQWARVSCDSTWSTWDLISSHSPSFQEPVILSIIKSDGFVPLMAGLIKRSSFLAAGGLKEEMWLVEDVRFLIDLYQTDPNFAVAPSDIPLFFYRRGQPSSLSTSKDRTAFYDACYNNTLYVEHLLKTDRRSMNWEQSNILVDIYGNLARFYFEQDRTKFHNILARIRTLNPNYLPSGPTHLRWLSRYIGYENAEEIALKYRQIKTLCFGTHRKPIVARTPNKTHSTKKIL